MCIAGVVIGIILVAVSLFPYLSEKSKNEELVKKEAELEPVEVVYAEYQNARLINEVSDYVEAQNRMKLGCLLESWKQLHLQQCPFIFV